MIIDDHCDTHKEGSICHLCDLYCEESAKCLMSWKDLFDICLCKICRKVLLFGRSLLCHNFAKCDWTGRSTPAIQTRTVAAKVNELSRPISF